MAGGLVDDALADQRGNFGCGIGLQRGETRQGLHHVVVDGAAGEWAGTPEANDLDVDEALTAEVRTDTSSMPSLSAACGR